MVAKTRSSKVNRAWLQDHLNDPYVRMAQADGYRSRAAYKLKEIDEAFRLLQPGQVVVDLGAAPGAWSQYLRRRFAEQKDGGAAAGEGMLVALDLLPMEPIDGVRFVQGDFRETAALRELERALDGRVVDVVVSDMAPNLSGIAAADAARMADLVELAVDFSVRHLHPKGALVAKVFHGSGYSQLVERFKQAFRIAKPYKPKASRGRSAETFLVGIGLKQQARSEKAGEWPGNPDDSAAQTS